MPRKKRHNYNIFMGHEAQLVMQISWVVFRLDYSYCPSQYRDLRYKVSLVSGMYALLIVAINYVYN